jgi:hypothetical protein
MRTIARFLASISVRTVPRDRLDPRVLQVHREFKGRLDLRVFPVALAARTLRNQSSCHDHRCVGRSSLVQY